MMREPLDQQELGAKVKRNLSKHLNAVLIILSLVIVLFTIWKIWNNYYNMVSPWLPKYAAHYLNRENINLTVILTVGMLAAFVFRIIKHYATSSFVLISFLILGFIFDDRVELYKYFY